MQELHTRYYEPLARIAPSLEDILQGPPVKKLLFMTDPAVIDSDLKPLWQARHLACHIFSGAAIIRDASAVQRYGAHVNVL